MYLQLHFPANEEIHGELCIRDSTVSRNVGTVHLSLFHHFHSPLLGYRRQLHIFKSETACIGIQEMVTVLYFQFAVKLTVKAIGHDLNRTPHLLDGKITSLFFVVRSYNTCLLYTSRCV